MHRWASLSGTARLHSRPKQLAHELRKGLTGLHTATFAAQAPPPANRTRIPLSAVQDHGDARPTGPSLRRRGMGDYKGNVSEENRFGPRLSVSGRLDGSFEGSDLGVGENKTQAAGSIAASAPCALMEQIGLARRPPLSSRSQPNRERFSPARRRGGGRIPTALEYQAGL